MSEMISTARKNRVANQINLKEKEGFKMSLMNLNLSIQALDIHIHIQKDENKAERKVIRKLEQDMRIREIQENRMKAAHQYGAHQLF